MRWGRQGPAGEDHTGPGRQEATARRGRFALTYGGRYRKAVACLETDWDRTVALLPAGPPNQLEDHLRLRLLMTDRHDWSTAHRPKIDGLALVVLVNAVGSVLLVQRWYLAGRL